MASHAPSPEQDQKLEVAMGHLLRVGVSVAACVVFAGGVLYLHNGRAPVPDYHTFHAEAGDLRSISAVLRRAPSLNSAALIQAGILLLIATPVARVIFALLGFAFERDWLYTAISAVVLAVLLFSLMHFG